MPESEADIDVEKLDVVLRDEAVMSDQFERPKEMMKNQFRGVKMKIGHTCTMQPQKKTPREATAMVSYIPIMSDAETQTCLDSFDRPTGASPTKENDIQHLESQDGRVRRKCDPCCCSIS